MKPNLKNKIKKIKEDPRQKLSHMERAKIFLDPYYQQAADATAVKQPVLQPVNQPEEKKALIPDSLIKAQQWKETGGTFKPNMVSKKGAKGVGQIMPNTWKEAVKKGWIDKSADIFDPKANEIVQRKTMEWLLERPSVKGDINRALAAYNWGIGNFSKHVEKHGDKWYENLKDNPETYDYVEKILNYQKNLEQH